MPHRERPIVMVVEDDVEMNELERELLAVHGLDSVPAYTGKEALDVCALHRADAVLLDIMLPEMDGLEACKRLHSKEKSLPIVIVTALDGEESRRLGFEAGASAYFCKPFDPTEVVNTIWDLVRKTRGCHDRNTNKVPIG